VVHADSHDFRIDKPQLDAHAAHRLDEPVAVVRVVSGSSSVAAGDSVPAAIREGDLVARSLHE
jgi:molybdopterin biosynthesis enzyme